MSNAIKKIGYLTALVIMTGGTIGAGIFYKSRSILTNSHNDYVYAILSWIVAAIGIICIGFALVEISSVTKKDSGIIAWVRAFTNKKIGRASTSYMLMIYYPFSILTLSIYGVNALEDAYMVATNSPLFPNGYIPAAIALAICLWLFFMSWLSFKMTEQFQWLFTLIKFIPIIILPIFAYIFAASGETGEKLDNIIPQEYGLIGTFKGWGIIASIPAILFTFDGFFTVASVRSNLKKTKWLPSIILCGLLIIITVYLYISIAFSIPNNNGEVTGIGKIPKWIKITMLSFICISVIGVVNGYTMATNRVYMIATNDYEFYFLSYLYKKLKWLTKRDVSYIFLSVLTTLLFFIVTPFAIEVWKLNPGIYKHSIYKMADLLTNYTSLFVFVIIGVAIFGGLVNRRTKRVKVEKSKLFIPSAIISTIFLIIGTIYFLISPLIDLAYLTNYEKKMQNIYTFLVMIGTLVISFINMWIEMYFARIKKENYFPKDYISISILDSCDENVSEELTKQAYIDFEEEGWNKIVNLIKKRKKNIKLQQK